MPDDGASLFGERPLHRRAADQPDDRRPSASGCSPGWPPATVDLARRHPRPDPGGRSRSGRSASWSSTSSTASASSSGPRCATKAGGDAVPDVLVMTATPIPRTAAMTVYGDLDVSVLDELPPGRHADRHRRGPQRRASSSEAGGVGEGARRGGRRAPGLRRVPADRGERQARGARRPRRPSSALRTGELAGPAARACSTAGSPPAEKERDHGARSAPATLDVLVATTVIEVGVDVPNATVMVILDADRFGIAQLHQLRGRVGRGADQSYCFLVGQGPTPDGEARLEAMVRTTDGFELAEVDLDLRGEGTIFGRAPEGSQRPEAGVAPPRQGVGGEGPPGGVRPGRRRSRPGRPPPAPGRDRPPPRARTTPSSCSRTDLACRTWQR